MEAYEEEAGTNVVHVHETVTPYGVNGRFDMTMIPTGYRFLPTDEELVTHYLMRKVLHRPLPSNTVKELDLYKYTPQQLEVEYGARREKEMYFFTRTKLRYASGNRPNRDTPGGCWKASTSKTSIRDDNGHTIGQKMMLVYHIKTEKREKTDWLMYEYTIPSCSKKMDGYVLCKVYNKGGKQELQISAQLEHRNIELQAQLNPTSNFHQLQNSELQIPRIYHAQDTAFRNMHTNESFTIEGAEMGIHATQVESVPDHHSQNHENNYKVDPNNISGCVEEGLGQSSSANHTAYLHQPQVYQNSELQVPDSAFQNTCTNMGIHATQVEYVPDHHNQDQEHNYRIDPYDISGCVEEGLGQSSSANHTAYLHQPQVYQNSELQIPDPAFQNICTNMGIHATQAEYVPDHHNQDQEHNYRVDPYNISGRVEEGLGQSSSANHTAYLHQPQVYQNWEPKITDPAFQTIYTNESFTIKGAEMGIHATQAEYVPEHHNQNQEHNCSVNPNNTNVCAEQDLGQEEFQQQQWFSYFLQ